MSQLLSTEDESCCLLKMSQLLSTEDESCCLLKISQLSTEDITKFRSTEDDTVAIY